MKKNKGFTLIELMVVLIILAILVWLILGNYNKMIEENRARNAVKILRMLGAARRMQMIDNGVQISTSSWINNNSFDGVTCPDDIGDIDEVGELHACGYGDLIGINWTAGEYLFYSCGGKGVGGWCCNSPDAPSNIVACTTRKVTAPDYSKGWKYFYTQDGQCIPSKGDATDDVPPCIE